MAGRYIDGRWYLPVDEWRKIMTEALDSYQRLMEFQARQVEKDFEVLRKAAESLDQE